MTQRALRQRNELALLPLHEQSKTVQLASCDNAIGVEARFLFHIDPKDALEGSSRDRGEQEGEGVLHIRDNVIGVEVVPQEARGAGHA